MPRPRKATTQKEPEKKTVEQQKTTRRSSLVDVYKQEAGPAITHIDKVKRPGAADLSLNPQYLPEEVEVRWAPIPNGSNDDYEFYRALEREHYILVREEHVAENIDEAKDKRLIYFETRLSSITLPSGDRAMGFPGSGLVLLFRAKEVGDRIRKKQAEEFDRMLRAGQDGLEEHVVKSKRGAVTDVLAETES